MFEEMTYEKLLNDMLSEVTSEVDKREGSIIWDALAPAALELSRLYKALDAVLSQGFADTAEREYLVLRAAERGLLPRAATYAGARAEILGDVEPGDRFYCGGYNWQVEEKLAEGEYLLRSEEVGSGPNSVLGRLSPLEYMEKLDSAEIVDIIEPGADEEGTEEFRARYFVNLSEQAFGGNRADYIEKAEQIAGVGAVKVEAAWNGAGTVKLILLDSEMGEPSESLVERVQNTFDPVESSGDGLGLAPIGHRVTVVSAKERKVNVSFCPTYSDGYQWSDVSAAVLAEIDKYFAELANGWANSRFVIVRVSQLEARILEVSGIEDISELCLDDVAANLPLLADEFPVRGDVSVE